MFTVGFCSKFAKFIVRFDSFLTLVKNKNSLSLIAEHHSSKMSILVRFQKRMKKNSSKKLNRYSVKKIKLNLKKVIIGTIISKIK